MISLLPYVACRVEAGKDGSGILRSQGIPTESFTILEPQSPWADVCEIHEIRGVADLETLKLYSVRCQSDIYSACYLVGAICQPGFLSVFE